MLLASLIRHARPLWVLAMLLSVDIAAEPRAALTPAMYVEIDLHARAVTLEGVEQRLVRLRENPYDEAGQYRVGQIVQGEVRRVFQEFGISQKEFLDFGSGYAADINEWLLRHPELMRQYDDLEQRREMLSAHIKAIKE